MPDASGQAWLQLPDTFDLENPTSWFATEVKPRIERRQDRALWKLTWEGAGRREKGLAHAGAREVEEPAKGSAEKPTLKTLWGPKLSQEEVNRARERAPTDRDGKLLCWGFLTHMGCSSANCQRAHEQLRGSFEALDTAVQTPVASIEAVFKTASIEATAVCRRSWPSESRPSEEHMPQTSRRRSRMA